MSTETTPATAAEESEQLVNGGELAVRTLLAAGVTQVFGLYGGHLETIFQGCLAHGLPVTDVRDEAAGGHAAEGYARSLGTLGVALATAGPGITNVVTSIANAHADRTPVLYLTASQAHSHAETNMVQGGIDNVAITRSITKWAHRVSAPADIPRLVAHAIRVATSAPTGPVLLDFPVDVTFLPIDERLALVPESIVSGARAAPSPASVVAALELLVDALRPVIIVGEDVQQAGAAGELQRLAETTGIPVFTHNNSHGALPSDHRLYGGTVFKLAELIDAEARPDVVLALGTRFGALTLSPSDRVIPADAKLIHIEVDPVEIGRRRHADVAIVADTLEALGAFNARLQDWTWQDLSGWQQTIGDTRQAREDRLRQLLARTSSPMHPFQAAHTIVETLPEDAILIGDGAETQEWLIEAAHQQRPLSYFGAGQLACLGYGLGFSIGIQVAHPQRPVVLVTGDGAVGFTTSELDTMARHGLPIVVIVFNNRMWGATRHFQAMISGPDRHTATELADTRYDIVAEGFGCRGAHVTELGGLAPAIQEALASRRPTLINVAVEFGEPPPDELLLASSF